MRSFRLAATLATIGLSISHIAAWAQPPSSTGSAIRQWFSSAGDGTAPAASGSNPAPDSAVHFLRQKTCNIPFTVDPSRNTPLELQLFVSTDRGGSWAFHARAAPTAGSFTFRAGEDGEYWFALRAIERSQLPGDVRNLPPGLKVVFDTLPPRLDFDASAMPDGLVSVKWDAEDANLDSDSMRIEYQLDPNGTWHALSLPRNGSPRTRQISAAHALRMEAQTASVLLRAEVRDLAGNPTIVSRPLTLRPASIARPVNPGSVPVAVLPDPVADGSVRWPRDNVLPAPIAPNTRDQSTVPDRSAPSASYGELPPPKPSADHPPTTLKHEMQRSPYFATTSNTKSGLAGGESNGVAESVSGGHYEPLPHDTRNVAVEREAPTPVPASTSGASQPPTAPGTESARVQESGGESVSGNASIILPAGDRPRMTNSRLFSLDYEVEAIGPADVERVELWGTPDGGRTWSRWQDDEDRQSPVDVQLDRDGVFGFRIVVVTTRQRSTDPPKPGEPADIWIGVDTTRPSVQITAAIYGDGEHAGEFDIRWQAFDTGLGERPITLSFSEHAKGPWSIIAAGLPNTGQYYWAVEPRIPREIYLRAEARDDAGNVGEHQVAEPVSTAGLIPHARIRGFRVPSPNRSASHAPVNR